jgi:hypothetical protein
MADEPFIVDGNSHHVSKEINKIGSKKESFNFLLVFNECYMFWERRG